MIMFAPFSSIDYHIRPDGDDDSDVVNGDCDHAVLSTTCPVARPQWDVLNGIVSH